MATNNNKNSQYIFLDILGRKWAVPVIRQLGNTVRRHSELIRYTPGITQKMLTDTLKMLERNGIVERIHYPVVPPQVEYKLTAIGLEMLDISDTLVDWSDKNKEKIKRDQKAYDRRTDKYLTR